MASSDPIADMLTIIRNGGKAGFAKVDIPGSKTKLQMVRVLKEQGYIKDFKFSGLFGCFLDNIVTIFAGNTPARCFKFL